MSDLLRPVPSTASSRPCSRRRSARPYTHCSTSRTYTASGVALNAAPLGDRRLTHPFGAVVLIHTSHSLHILAGGLHSPTDGTLDPAGLTTAYARGAKALGATVVEGVRVAGMQTEAFTTVDGAAATRVVSVTTECGQTVSTGHVVNACGGWSNTLSASVGAPLPLLAMKHAYVVTESLASHGMHGALPNVRDHDLSIYLKAQGQALAIGGALCPSVARLPQPPATAVNHSRLPLPACHSRLPLLTFAALGAALLQATSPIPSFGCSLRRTLRLASSTSIGTRSCRRERHPAPPAAARPQEISLRALPNLERCRTRRATSSAAHRSSPLESRRRSAGQRHSLRTTSRWSGHSPACAASGNRARAAAAVDLRLFRRRQHPTPPDAYRCLPIPSDASHVLL